MTDFASTNGTQIPTGLLPVLSLSGLGLVLSPIDDEDIERVYDACQDSEFARWLPFARGNYTWEEAESFVKDFVPKSWRDSNPVWGIHVVNEAGETGDHVGTISLTQSTSGVYEVGFWVHRDWQGKGVATRATALALEAAFDLLAAYRVVHFADVGNYRSLTIARKLGFLPEGVRRIEELDGRVVSQWQSAILRSDWEQRDDLYLTKPTRPHPKVLDGARPAALVSEFHRVYDMPNRVADKAAPTLQFDRLGMRMALIAEEVTELYAAVYGQSAGDLLSSVLQEIADEENRDLVETADALADLVYVIYGMALEVGIDLDQVLAEVHSSNLSKLMPDGSVKRRADGKILKGPGFEEPKIREVLDRLAKPDLG